MQGFRVTDESKSVFAEKDRDAFYVDYIVDIIDYVTIYRHHRYETSELKLSVTARTIAYRFSGKVDDKET